MGLLPGELIRTIGRLSHSFGALVLAAGGEVLCFVLKIIGVSVRDDVVGHGRRVGLGAAAAATAGVLVVSLAGGAYAMDRSGGSGHRGGGRGGAPHGHGPLAVAQRQAVLEATKTRTLESLYEQGMDSVTQMESSADQSPPRHGFQRVAHASSVQDEWHAFLDSDAEQQLNSHLMVVAHRIPSSGQPEAYLIVPSRNGNGGDEYMSDAGERLTFRQLAQLGEQGWNFYTKVGIRPLGSRPDIWWPAGLHRSKTRAHIEAIFEQNSVKANLLHLFYRPGKHEQIFTLQQLIREFNSFYGTDVSYDSSSSALSELAKAGLVKPERGAGKKYSPHHPGTYRALTREEIEARDALSIMERVREYPVPAKSVERRVLDHVYAQQNRTRDFTAETLKKEVLDVMSDEDRKPPVDLRKGKNLISATLFRLKDAGLVERISTGKVGKRGILARYRAIPEGE